MKRNFSGITAQQAPSPRTARQALVSLPGTLQTASQMPHCTRPNSIFASSRIKSSEMIDEAIDENRLARSQRSAQPAAPRIERDRKEGGLCGASVTDAMDQRSTSAMRALYQFMNRLMPRLMVRNTSMISAI